MFCCGNGRADEKTDLVTEIIQRFGVVPPRNATLNELNFLKAKLQSRPGAANGKVSAEERKRLDIAEFLSKVGRPVDWRKHTLAELQKMQQDFESQFSPQSSPQSSPQAESIPDSPSLRSVPFEVIEISDLGMLCQNTGPLPKPDGPGGWSGQPIPQRGYSTPSITPYYLDPQYERQRSAWQADSLQRQWPGYPSGEFFVYGNFSTKYSRGSKLIADLYLAKSLEIPTTIGKRTVLGFALSRSAANEVAAAHSSVQDTAPKSGASSEEIKGSGTGFAISDDGYVVTNYHVVKDASRVVISTAKSRHAARVVKTDSADDLAVLKIEAQLSALPIAASRGVKLGDTVATIGFPNPDLQGFSPKLSKGEIGALSGVQDDTRYFQISAAVQPGNSGGALVDERGNVVGVVSAKLSAKAALATSGALPEGINYAVKSFYLLSLLESLPEVKLKNQGQQEMKFSDVVQKAEQAAVMVLVY